MSAPELPFFVYGTLRPGEVNHDLLLRGRTLREEPARLAGAVLYQGPGYPYAVEEPGGTITGELVTPLPRAYALLLAELDRLEEYVPGDPRNLYERVEREVAVPPVTTAARGGDGCGDGREEGEGAALRGAGPVVRAWVYVAAPAVADRLRARGKLIESGDWLTRR
ncbi:gamma-glutamylcyclotransferase [Streptomyces sp. NBC_00015]|uniref:gamma-glutamylcyclotransferase family protein n=1 Tax=unclassified Streptomyces TaxID=2593676 RepID=UPI00224CC8FF|nr:gamma-glutamylcyclotransferase family protein [Streptomyces sp. NBC_00103]MCX5370087.1 gamma-glutamylcyclotransferase [Streptomyces sp. NBC_00103]